MEDLTQVVGAGHVAVEPALGNPVAGLARLSQRPQRGVCQAVGDQSRQEQEAASQKGEGGQPGSFIVSHLADPVGVHGGVQEVEADGQGHDEKGSVAALDSEAEGEAEGSVRVVALPQDKKHHWNDLGPV